MKATGYIIAFFMLIVGDRIVAQWVAAFRAWYDLLADEEFKRKCDENFERHKKTYQNFKQDQS